MTLQRRYVSCIAVASEAVGEGEDEGARGGEAALLKGSVQILWCRLPGNVVWVASSDDLSLLRADEESAREGRARGVHSFGPRGEFVVTALEEAV